MTRKTPHDLNDIIDDIIDYFPRIPKQMRVESRYISFRGTILMINDYVNTRHVVISSDPQAAYLPEKVVIGAVAHELSHIEMNSTLTYRELTHKMRKYAQNKRFELLTERNTDRHAIYRGFGRELLAFNIWVKRTMGDEPETGLRTDEIRKYL